MGPGPWRKAGSVTAAAVLVLSSFVVAVVVVPEFVQVAHAQSPHTVYTDTKNSYIRSVTTNGSVLFVAFRNFTIAILNPSTGAVLKAPTSFGPAGSGYPLEMLYYNGALYVGDDIEPGGTAGTYYLYRINPITLAVTNYVDPWTPGGVGFVEQQGGHIWVGTGNSEYLYELDPADLHTIAVSPSAAVAEDAWYYDGTYAYSNVATTGTQFDLNTLAVTAQGSMTYRPVGYFKIGSTLYVGDDGAEEHAGVTSTIWTVGISGPTMTFTSAGSVPNYGVINKGGAFVYGNNAWTNTYGGLSANASREYLYQFASDLSVNSSYYVTAKNANVLIESSPMVFNMTVSGLLRVYWYSDQVIAWVSPNATASADNNHEVAITITNSQSSPTPAPFQALIQRSWLNYTYADADLANFRFFSDQAMTTPLYSWLETGTKSTTSTFWVKLPNAIPANSAVTIYVNMSSTDAFSSYAGAAPQLTGTYGASDNGLNVFDFYRNFNGTTADPVFSSVASSATATRNNGLTMTSTTITGWYNLYTTSKISTEVLEAWPGSMTLDSYIMTAQSTSVPTSGGNIGVTTGWRYEYLQNSLGYGLYRCSASTCTQQGSFVAGGPGVSAAQPLSGWWTNAPWQQLDADYVSKITAAATNLAYNSTTYASVIYYNHGTGTQSLVLDWVRTRAIPPANVMPTVTFADVLNPNPPPPPPSSFALTFDSTFSSVTRTLNGATSSTSTSPTSYDSGTSFTSTGKSTASWGAKSADLWLYQVCVDGTQELTTAAISAAACQTNQFQFTAATLTLTVYVPSTESLSSIISPAGTCGITTTPTAGGNLYGCLYSGFSGTWTVIYSTTTPTQSDQNGQVSGQTQTSTSTGTGTATSSSTQTSGNFPGQPSSPQVLQAESPCVQTTTFSNQSIGVIRVGCATVLPEAVNVSLLAVVIIVLIIAGGFFLNRRGPSWPKENRGSSPWK